MTDLFAGVLPKCRAVHCTRDAEMWARDANAPEEPEVPCCAGHLALLTSHMQPIVTRMAERDV